MEIEFWMDARGGYPVAEYLDELPEKHRKKIIKWLEQLEDKGLQLGAGLLEKVDKFPNMWEFKVDFSNYRYRGLFTVFKNVAWFVHMFHKKDQKLRETDKNIGRKRIKKIHSFIE